VTKTMNLLSVKTINRKLALQIQQPDYRTGAWTAIYESLKSHENAPLGWCWLREIDPSSSRTSPRKVWLVKSGPNYYWYGAPDPGSELDKLHSPTLEQLFVS
jgi:hypothetical protein